jgi:membrane-associated tyrosine/threonine-specific cdc2-inhibitory kinase
LSEIYDLNLETSIPIRCTSNSVVYKATSNGESWAVKITSNRRRVEEEYAKRIELGNSPYLVRTVSLQHISHKSVLQMEYCPFGDLAKLQLPEKDVWQLMNNIGNALEHVHAAGWIHLEVSPGNILRADDSFKLADFGTLTKIGHFSEGCEGAGPYVSPEVLAFPFGRHGVTGQTDVFSFGVVLLETLTGQAAPRGGSEGYGRLRRGEIAVGIRPYEADCSEQLGRIVNTMLRANPGERPTPRQLVELSMTHCALS